jgi:hypothetical protein
MNANKEWKCERAGDANERDDGVAATRSHFLARLSEFNSQRALASRENCHSLSLRPPAFCYRPYKFIPFECVLMRAPAAMLIKT